MSGCPICGKPMDPVLRPFCSKRCADVDLQRWFSGRYVIPGSPDEGGEERQNSEQDPED